MTISRLAVLLASAAVLAGCGGTPAASTKTSHSPTPSPTLIVLVNWKGHDPIKDIVSDQFTVTKDHFTIRYAIDCTNSPDPVNDKSISFGLQMRDPAKGTLSARDVVAYGPVTTAKPTGTVTEDGPGTFELVILTTCGHWSVQATEGGQS